MADGNGENPKHYDGRPINEALKELPREVGEDIRTLGIAGGQSISAAREANQFNLQDGLKPLVQFADDIAQSPLVTSMKKDVEAYAKEIQNDPNTLAAVQVYIKEQKDLENALGELAKHPALRKIDKELDEVAGASEKLVADTITAASKQPALTDALHKLAKDAPATAENVTAIAKSVAAGDAKALDSNLNALLDKAGAVPQKEALPNAIGIGTLALGAEVFAINADIKKANESLGAIALKESSDLPIPAEQRTAIGKLGDAAGKWFDETKQKAIHFIGLGAVPAVQRAAESNIGGGLLGVVADPAVQKSAFRLAEEAKDVRLLTEEVAGSPQMQTVLKELAEERAARAMIAGDKFNILDNAELTKTLAGLAQTPALTVQNMVDLAAGVVTGNGEATKNSAEALLKKAGIPQVTGGEDVQGHGGVQGGPRGTKAPDQISH